MKDTGTPEKRILSKEEEIIIFQEGWPYESLDRGWFCKVTMDNICVEAFGPTKRAALKAARKFWNQVNRKNYQQNHGYPKIVPSEQRFDLK
jgi:hypothetical protein